MRDEFAALSGCSAIWGLVRERSVDQYRERTTADAAVDRKPVSLSVDTCDLIQWEQGVPHFKNGNGGDIYLYPGFIIYRAAKGAFSLISSHDLQVHAVMVDFHEEWAIPSDSRTVGYDWAKQNKDGSRDRRFVNNYQIPVVQYGRLSLKSDTGLWEEFLFSAPERLKNFVNVWAAFESSFDDARASA